MKIRTAIFYLCAMIATHLIYRMLIDDFAPSYLIHPNAETKQTTLPPSAILSQEFSYLCKGQQAYVFVSKDGNYILKLCKKPSPSFSVSLFSKKYTIRCSKFPFAKDLFSRLCPQLIENQRIKDLQSYQTAFSLLQEETKLLYLHTNITNHLQQKLHLRDKLGFLWKINADTSCFLLQEKTDMLYPTLHSHIQKHREKEARQLLASFVHLNFQLLQCGIQKPTTIEANIGCLGTKAIQIDVGRICIRKDFSKTGPLWEEIEYGVHHMKKWLYKHAPHLLPHLEECIIQEKLSRAIAL